MIGPMIGPMIGQTRGYHIVGKLEPLGVSL